MFWGFCSWPTTWAVPFRSSVAPKPTARFWVACGRLCPSYSVLLPPFRTMVPAPSVSQLPPMLKYCGALKRIVPPRLVVTFCPPV